VSVGVIGKRVKITAAGVRAKAIKTEGGSERIRRLYRLAVINDPALISSGGGCREIVVIDRGVCGECQTDAQGLDFLARIVRLH